MESLKNTRVSFASDYLEGAHPEILRRLTETNLIQAPGYGLDAFSESARAKIRTACKAPDADIYFLAGGTQSNATVIDAMLRSYQGVIAAETGHISGHEAGAIEFGGHKVLTVSNQNGKITAESVRQCISRYQEDQNRDHLIMPGMVYLSQPTEFGTLYSLQELDSISKICREHGLPLYLDGARLADALACPGNDVTLPDIARLCDVFYIGGTKCGALFGEAVVFPEHNRVPHFFSIVKQHGALLAKGRAAGIQFDALFTDRLYETVGQTAIQAAEQIRAALRAKGYTFAFESPTNQIFILLNTEQLERLSARFEMGFWEKADAGRTIIRIATSWATTDAAVSSLIEYL